MNIVDENIETGEKTCIRSGYCLYKPTPKTCNKNCPYYVDSGKRREYVNKLPAIYKDQLND